MHREAAHALPPGCSYFADVDSEFVPVDICLLPDFSLWTPRVGGKVEAGAQPLRGPPRQNWGRVLLVTQVLALQHVLGVLPEQVSRHRRHVDHPGEARRERWARLAGCPLRLAQPWSHCHPQMWAQGRPRRGGVPRPISTAAHKTSETRPSSGWQRAIRRRGCQDGHDTT